MRGLRLGILGTSDIAFRRFLPALQKNHDFHFAGVASRDIEKTKRFTDVYGGRGFEGYDALVESDEIDVVYIPLPPALHAEWAKKALLNKKHVLIEKPSTVTLADCYELVELAKQNNLALQENYMFQYHSQFNYIQQTIEENILGDIRLIRIAFGFPKRLTSDFRYQKDLGGGALLDCGGYPIKLATILLGDEVRVATSSLNFTDFCEVDVYGSATLQNEKQLTAQISFGMDNSYKCELEIWGSKGSISAPRIFTAPTGFRPEIFLQNGDERKTISLPEDDQFLNAIEQFFTCIVDENERTNTYNSLLVQAKLINDIMN